MRRPLYLANWKMHKTESETRAWFDAAGREDSRPDAADIGVAPPFTALRVASDCLSGAGSGVRLPFVLAAQDCHWESSGAFTGEVSPRMLAEHSVRYVLVGHSERRQLFGETDERIARKLQAVCAAEMVPVLCLGETQAERDAGRTEAVVETQLRLGLDRLDAARVEFVIAYEPVWAIGTGRTATPDQVAEVHRFLRTTLAGLAGEATAERTRILYGGSVNAATVASIARLADVDGALVGGASLDPAGFLDLVRRGATAS